MSVQVYDVPRSSLVRPKAISGSTMSRRHVGRANSTIIGIEPPVFFSSPRGLASFRGKRKIGFSFGMGNRRRWQKEETTAGEAAGACPGMVSWTSFCASLAPVDRLAPRNVRCIVQLVIALAGTRSSPAILSTNLFPSDENDYVLEIGTFGRIFKNSFYNIKHF